MEKPILSFWGTDPVPLPPRFARIKRQLIAGHEEALSASWGRLITALRDEIDHIEALGAHLIPSIEFDDIDDPAQTTRFARDLKRYGVGVVRGVVPKSDADIAVKETLQYLESKKIPPPPPQDPTCFDFFWTPAQVRARAHPNVLRAQRFMMSLWETSAEDKVAVRFPIAYADRIRIHGLDIDGSKNETTPSTPDRLAPGPGPDASELSGSSSNGTGPSAGNAANPPPPSADQWINSIQSSTLLAQVDNGSLERWEPDGYQRGGTYDHVFRGEWDAYDAWDCSGRVSATLDLYNGYAACSIFRMFQGLLALSTIEPDMVRLLPSPKLATAYILLRPFFSPKYTPPPHVRDGPEWEAFLATDNWSLDKDQSTVIHGAVPGHAQRVSELWHPHLALRRSLVTLPTLQAGDYIFWHPDLPYHIASDGTTGLKSSRPATSSGGSSSSGSAIPPVASAAAPDGKDVRMLVYVPAAPLTQTNALYLARQRKAFLRGHPGPDFDSAGTSKMGSESPHQHMGRLGEKEIRELGGPAALQAMGFAAYELAGTPKGKDVGSDDVEMAGTSEEADTKSLKSTTSSSHAEAEVVSLANVILFPETSFMGLPYERTKKP